jgi:hypothetical protein
MAFWTDSGLQPTRKYKFLLSSDGPGSSMGNWWWAKTVSKPSYEINQNSYQLGNHKFKYPGVLTWNDVEVTIADVGSKTKDLYTNLNKMGYSIPTSNSTGIAKDRPGTIKEVIIRQVSDSGETVEEWTLYNVLITRLDFGNLSYEDDGLVELSFNLTYDYAKLI